MNKALENLSKEGFKQLNNWFITYPVHIGAALGYISSRYPDFARIYLKQLKEIQAKADKLTIKVLECKAN